MHLCRGALDLCRIPCGCQLHVTMVTRWAKSPAPDADGGAEILLYMMVMFQYAS